MTTNQAINEKMINLKDNIEILLNKKIININLNLKRNIWSSKELNFTCIEIIEEDKIIKNINPFDINSNCFNKKYNNNNFDKKGILIVSKSKSKRNYYKEKDDLNFFHNCNLKVGYSGNPIILLDDLSLIGINSHFNEKENTNIGIYLSSIIHDINSNKYISKNNNNDKDISSYENKDIMKIIRIII